MVKKIDDNIDLDYRESLANEIDREEGSERKKRSIGSQIDKTKNKAKEIVSINEYKEVIDYDKERIDLYDGETLVGEIYNGTFYVGGEEVENHIGIEVNYNYRNRGIGKKLYKIFEKEFGLPDVDYTRQIGKLRFFESIGYEPVSIINDMNGKEIPYDEEDSIINMIGNGYSCKVEK